MNATQLIFVCDHHEIANSRNSEIPEWPVQDEGAHWHYRQFDSQRVAYNRSSVEFGFLANLMSSDEVSTIDKDDLPSDVYVVGSDFYKSV